MAQSKRKNYIETAKGKTGEETRGQGAKKSVCPQLSTIVLISFNSESLRNTVSVFWLTKYY